MATLHVAQAKSFDTIQKYIENQGQEDNTRHLKVVGFSLKSFYEEFLYNVLNEFDKTFYEENRENCHDSLYTNRALYSPNVRFFKGDRNCLTDVLTCAAPNYTSAYKYNCVSKEENTKALEDRVKFVLDIASKEKVDTLILGAWGCGVFGQDPSEVVKLFIAELFNHKDIENIVFAVIDKDSENYLAFKDVLENRQNS